jgi:hypothetical protein
MHNNDEALTEVWTDERADYLSHGKNNKVFNAFRYSNPDDTSQSVLTVTVTSLPILRFH